MISSGACVSVIVAVYNVERYIVQCCHSLFSQTLERLEFIFVDDCSPDNSIAVVRSVLEMYPNRVSQVKFIRHDINMGISRTREDGVKVASGEYIIYCDPDDWVESNMYEQMYNKAKEESADMVLCDMYDVFPDNSSRISKQAPLEFSNKSILASLLRAQMPVLGGWLWNKLIKAQYYRSVEWPYSINCCEDKVVCVQIFVSQPIRVSYVNKALYHYRHSYDSLSIKCYSREDSDNDYKLIKILHDYLCKENDKDLERYWQANILSCMRGGVENAHRKLYTNKEFTQKYKRYRNCIWKDAATPLRRKILLYFAIYDYSLVFDILKIGAKIKTALKNILIIK